MDRQSNVPISAAPARGATMCPADRTAWTRLSARAAPWVSQRSAMTAATLTVAMPRTRPWRNRNATNCSADPASRMAMVDATKSASPSMVDGLRP